MVRGSLARHLHVTVFYVMSLSRVWLLFLPSASIMLRGGRRCRHYVRKNRAQAGEIAASTSVRPVSLSPPKPQASS